MKFLANENIPLTSIKKLRKLGKFTVLESDKVRQRDLS